MNTRFLPSWNLYSKEVKHINNTIVVIIHKLYSMARNIKQVQEMYMEDQSLEEGVVRSSC